MKIVNDWIAKFGKLPEGATHICEDKMGNEHECRAIHRLDGAASEFWSADSKKWELSAYTTNDPELIKIPEEYLKMSKNDLCDIQIGAECDHVCVVVDRKTGNVVEVDVPGLSDYACNCIVTAINRALEEAN